MVLGSFAKVKRRSLANIKKEIVFSLLEGLLTLHIGVCTFSLVQDKV